VSKPSLLLRLLTLLLAVVVALAAPPAVLAGPVQWLEVPATSEGRQWWDGGSLRRTRDGTITVLSRFQPADQAERQGGPIGDLYVMEIDCDLGLYRDTSVNGLPRFGASWQPAGEDDLIHSVIATSCAAASALLP
jgi:hypothetical protein